MTGRDMPPTRNETEQSATPFVDKARALVAEAANQEPLEQLAAATSFLESIEEAAAAGNITSMNGAAYPKEVIDEQLTYMYHEATLSPDKRELQSPELAMPRSGGLRESVAVLFDDVNMAPALMEALSRREFEKKRIKVDLAEVAIRSDVAQSPTEMVQAQVENESIDTKEAAIEGQLKQLNEKYNDSLELWRYASGTMNSAEYRRDGDTASAYGEQHKADNALKKLRTMGPDAVADAKEYLELMRRLKSLRDRRQ